MTLHFASYFVLLLSTFPSFLGKVLCEVLAGIDPEVIASFLHNALEVYAASDGANLVNLEENNGEGNQHTWRWR